MKEKLLLMLIYLLQIRKSGQMKYKSPKEKNHKSILQPQSKTKEHMKSNQLYHLKDHPSVININQMKEPFEESISTNRLNPHSTTMEEESIRTNQSIRYKKKYFALEKSFDNLNDSYTLLQKSYNELLDSYTQLQKECPKENERNLIQSDSECPEGQFLLNVRYKVDYNNRVKWQVKQLKSGEVVWDNDEIVKVNGISEKLKCVQDSTYVFETFTRPVEYTVRVNNIIYESSK